MTPKDLKARTEKFSSEIVAFCTPLLDHAKTMDVARQLLRAGTAVDSNYGSAQRARSHKEFTSRLGMVLDEVSESLGWLTLLKKSHLAPETPLLNALHTESDELTRIFAASYRTAKEKELRDAEEKKHRRERPPRHTRAFPPDR